MGTYETVRNVWERMKYPVYYTAGYTALSAATEGAKQAIAGNLEGMLARAGDTAMHNAPFFALVNLIYSGGVEMSTRKWGRIGGNAFCALVNIGFYAYASLTSDSDPALPCAINAAVGFYMTNKHISSITQNTNKFTDTSAARP